MLVLTNNPLVYEKLKERAGIDVDFQLVSFRELLVAVRNHVHAGHRLLTHPLSGSVKPNETPYKSVMVSREQNTPVCADSVMLIEQAIATCDRFSARHRELTEQMHADFQLIDWTLISSALGAAQTYPS